MIGWKCKVGYSEQDYNNGLNYSNITFTDNSIFSFPTNVDLSKMTMFSGTPNINHRTPAYSDSELTNLLVDSFGDDYSATYAIPCYALGFGDVTQEDVVKLMPSLFLTSPNLAQISSQTQVRNIFCEIPGLNVILWYENITNVPRPTFLDKNGDILTIHSFTNSDQFFYASVSGQRFVFIQACNGFDGTKDSLLNPENYSLIVFAAYNSSYYKAYCGYYPYLTAYLNGFKERIDFLFNNYTPPDFDFPDNPYEPGGPSGPTDPDLPPGTFDDESDPIPDSPLPTLSAANTGFTRIYNPTLSQVQALARYLWTDPDVIQTIWNHIKQFFEDPMEAIIGFNLVPVPVPDGGTENFALMYIDTGVQMTVAANQFVDLDCGTLELKRYYGSALDQSPYTKVSCYLPYIGTVNLNTDEVMGTTLQVKYRVDIVSGSCVAKIFVDGTCLYQYSGHCAITIPISSADFSSYVSAAISVGKLASAAITAGAGAAMASGVGEVAQQTNQVVTTTQTTNTARNPATGRQITTGTSTTVQTRESPADQSSTQASFSGLSPQNVANTVGAIMSSKPHIEHSGSFSGNSGYLGVRRPFVIIERPNMCMPANYQALNGFPAMITMELGTCKGFTRIQQVQLTGLHATNPEQAEILEFLKSGVIL